MKHNFLVTLTFALTFQLVHAQENLKEIKNDIGFNTNIFLNGVLNTGGSPFNLMYKRQIAETHALRYGLIFNANFNSQSGSNPNYTLSNSYNISPSIGKEWQHAAGKNWIWYCGADIRFNVFGATSDIYNNYLQTSAVQINRYGAAFSPFLGLRFVINERLYLATEANLNIAYSYQKNKNKLYDNTGNVISDQDFSTNSVNAASGSAIGIFVFYRF